MNKRTIDVLKSFSWPVNGDDNTDSVTFRVVGSVQVILISDADLAILVSNGICVLDAVQQ